jgi:hypothetical protein
VVVDPDRLEEFCRDDDGCMVSLRSESDAPTPVFRASEWRVYLSGTSAWSSSINTSLKTDGDNAGESGASVNGPEGVCSFWDSDDLAGNDAYEGFTLFVASLLADTTITCVMVLSD